MNLENNLEIDLKNKEQLYKYCYEYCESVEWDNKKIKNLAIQLNRTVDTIRQYARIYAIEYLKISKETLMEKISVYASLRAKEKARSEKELSKYNILFAKLCFEDDPRKIIELIENADVIKGALKERVFNYVMKYYPDQVDELVYSLKQKIDIYLNYCKKRNKLIVEAVVKEKRRQRKEQIVLENMPKAEKYINMFINQEVITKKDFCKSTKLNLSDFEAFVELVKNNNKELYEKYLQKIKFEANQRYLDFIFQINEVIELIKNGVIEENGNVREFNLLDYYLIIKLNNETVFDIGKKVLDNQEMNLLRKFIGKNSTNVIFYDSINLKKLLDEKVEINCQKDKKGFPIPGTGKIITREEKQSIIDYLMENRVPLNSKTYDIALKRYLNGNLIVSESKTYSKKI